MSYPLTDVTPNLRLQLSGMNVNLAENFVTLDSVTGSPSNAVVVLTADSSTDNLSTINAALAALPSTGGTITLVPSGSGYCFVSDTITITTSGVILGGTSVNPTQAAFGNCVLHFPTGKPGIIISGANNVCIQNMTLLSADSGSVSGDYGIWVKGSSTAPTIRGVCVRSFGDSGIKLDSSSSGNVNHWRLDQVVAYSNFGDGFTFTGGTDTNVGLGLQCDATGNGGWGINLDIGASSNTFIEPHVSGNTTGGYRVNTNSNFFHNVYSESAATSSFIFTSSSNNNYVQFNLFGQPTTITNSGGASNTFFYNKGTIPGYANFSINPQDPSSGHTYTFTNGSFNGNDLAITDDTGSTWIDINFSLNAVAFLKEHLAANFTAATSGGSTNSGKLSWYASFWNGSASATDKWSAQSIGGSGTNGTSTLTISHTGSSGAATLEIDSGLTVTGTLISSTSHTPSSAADTGVAGTISWDASFIYVCTATNTWKRAAISSW